MVIILWEYKVRVQELQPFQRCHVSFLQRRISLFRLQVPADASYRPAKCASDSCRGGGFASCRRNCVNFRVSAMKLQRTDTACCRARAVLCHMASSALADEMLCLADDCRRFVHLADKVLCLAEEMLRLSDDMSRLAGEHFKDLNRAENAPVHSGFAGTLLPQPQTS